MAKKIQYFREIPRLELPVTNGRVAGDQYINNLLSLGVGSGNSVFRADQQGIWLGADKYEDAPWKVSITGAMYFSAMDGLASIVIDSTGITQWYNGIPVGFWGIQTGGF